MAKPGLHTPATRAETELGCTEYHVVTCRCKAHQTGIELNRQRGPQTWAVCPVLDR